MDHTLENAVDALALEKACLAEDFNAAVEFADLRRYLAYDPGTGAVRADRTR